MIKVFIDGKSGTTGLRIYDRLNLRSDVTVITLSEEVRHDPEARREAIKSADAAFFCLPDDAARESAGLAGDSDTVILDTSTAHRTAPGWCYGFPELSPEREAEVRASKRIAVPGCHASGFCALVAPLTQAGIIKKDAHLSAFSLTRIQRRRKEDDRGIRERGAQRTSFVSEAVRAYAEAQAPP